MAIGWWAQILKNQTPNGRKYQLALQDYVAMKWTRDTLANVDDGEMGDVLRITSSAFNSNKAGLLKRVQGPHGVALEALGRGHLRQAVHLYENILLNNANDLLALQCAHDLHLKLGDAKSAWNVVARVLPLYSPSMPEYGLVLTLYGNGLHEVGNQNLAMEKVDHALSMNPFNMQAILVKSKIFASQGIHNAGASYLQNSREVWEEYPIAKPFLYMKWIMFLLETGEFRKITKILHDYVIPVASLYTDINLLTNLTNIMIRLHFENHIEPTFLPNMLKAWKTIPLHQKMPYHQLLQMQAEYYFNNIELEPEPLRDAEILTTSTCIFSNGHFRKSQLPNVYNSSLQAMQHYIKGNYAEALSLFLSVRNHTSLLGAHRLDLDVQDLLHIQCALLANNSQVTKSLLQERLTHQPSNAHAWKCYASVHQDLNQTKAYANAKRIASQLGRHICGEY